MFTNKTVKLLSLILALIMVFALALTGCKDKTSSDDDDKKGSSSSGSSSTPAPSAPVVNEEAKEILDKYDFELPNAKSLWFSDMEYVSLIEENEGITYFEQIGYDGDNIKKYVSLIVTTRENLVTVGYIEENSDKALEDFFAELKAEGEGNEYVSYYFNKDDTYVAMAQIVEKNDEYCAYVFESTVSEFVSEALEYGAVLEFGKKSDYVKEEDDNNTSDKKEENFENDIPVQGGDDADQDVGGSEEVVVKEINPEYEALFRKYGFTEPRVMAGGKFEILAEDSDGDGIELYYYFANKDGKIEQAIAFAILTREGFAKQFNIQNNDTAIKGVVDMLPGIYEQLGFEASASYDEDSVLVQMSVTENNTDMDIDFIGKKLADVVADEIADGAVKKFLD